jgi:hypothetical protein
MSDANGIASFCGHISLVSYPPNNECFFLSNQSDLINENFLQADCFSESCINDCQNLSYMYNANFNVVHGVTIDYLFLWWTCPGVPNITSAMLNGLLLQNNSEILQQLIPDTSTEALQNITSATT